jgi:hypothetical protein
MSHWFGKDKQYQCDAHVVYKSLQPMPDGALSSAFAADIASPAWLNSFAVARTMS